MSDRKLRPLFCKCGKPNYMNSNGTPKICCGINKSEIIEKKCEEEIHNSGYIYCLSNPSIPELLKIGMTTRTPEERAKELYTTGVAAPFKIELTRKVNNPAEKEALIHKLLEDFRMPSREFFKVSVDKVKNIFDTYLPIECICIESFGICVARKFEMICNNEFHEKYNIHIDSEKNGVKNISISLKNKNLPEFEEIDYEIDREARELLQIRKELAEKKRIEENEKNKELNDINSLLDLEILLCLKTHTLPNDPLKKTLLPTHHYVPWNPSHSGKSPKEMLEHYKEIIQYKESCIPEINKRIEEWIQEHFNKMITDDSLKRIIGQGETFQNNNSLEGIIDELSGCEKDLYGNPTTTGSNYWKRYYISSYIRPKFGEEWNRYNWYCRILYEKNKNKPSFDEAILKIRTMEQELIKLRERNKLLEDKIQVIRDAMFHIVPT